MARKPLTHQSVFSDPEFASTYLSKHRKLLARLGKEYCAKLLERGFEEGMVIDVGCGFGEINLAIAERFPKSRHVGIDLSEPLLDSARESAARRNVADRVEFANADAQNIPYDADSFDVAFSLNMLHIVDEPLNMLDEIERVLKPGGMLYMLDLRRSWLALFEKEIRASYTLDEARELINRSSLRDGEYSKDMLFWKFEVR